MTKTRSSPTFSPILFPGGEGLRKRLVDPGRDHRQGRPEIEDLGEVGRTPRYVPKCSTVLLDRGSRGRPGAGPKGDRGAVKEGSTGGRRRLQARPQEGDAARKPPGRRVGQPRRRGDRRRHVRRDRLGTLPMATTPGPIVSHEINHRLRVPVKRRLNHVE
jgi:hypothetical protein